MLFHRPSTRRRAAVAGAVAALFLLSGCGAASPAGKSAAGGATGSGTTAAPRTPVTSPSSTLEAGIPAQQTPGSATSDRGLPLQTEGRELRLQQRDGGPVITLTVTSLAVQDTCPVDGGRPAHDAFALLEVEASFAKPADAESPAPPLQLSPASWSFYSADGSRYDGGLGTTPATSCQNAGNALPAELTPGSSVRGTLVLDLPARDGALVLADGGTDVAEWPLP
ncbi:MAG TPA: hypothetical protein VN621_04340 [Arthrobacter sp.]|nr:hypothetical protein [Arthrobacter sp.]